jgi:DNA replication protein DnaC
VNVDQVRMLAHQLRLFGVWASVERLAARAVADGHHPLEFARLLLEEEVLERKNRVAKALTTRAKFRHGAALEDFDTTFERGISKATMKELSTLAFFHRKESLLLFGKTGEGKTHLAIALGHRLCADGLRTAFMPVNFLFEEVAAAKAAGKYLSFIRTLNQAKALILDDFGLRKYTHDEATVLIDLLEERYQKGSVIVTSQVSDKGWQKLFDDPVIAEGIVNRLTEPSCKIVLTGGSYRERLGKKTQ